MLAGLVFYALDPLVDRLQRLRVPRVIGAGLAIALVIGACSFVAYGLTDDALRVVEELPAAARKVREKWFLNDIASQIERYIRVQLLTCVVVVAAGLGIVGYLQFESIGMVLGVPVSRC